MILMNENLVNIFLWGLLVFRGDRKVTEAWTGRISGWIKGDVRI
jgi:hypothetical protein